MNLLADSPIKINKNCIIDFPRNGSKGIDKEARKKCKILKFSEKFKFSEVLELINALNFKEYPKLFIFVIQTFDVEFYQPAEKALLFRRRILIKNSDIIQDLHQCISNLSDSRPFIIQLTSNSKNETKIYYKVQPLRNFVTIDALNEHLDQIDNFATFLKWFLSTEPERFENKIIEILRNSNDRSLILRFLRTLDLNKEFLSKLIIEVAKFGTKSDLIAILDTSLDQDGRMLNDEAQNWISSILNEKPSTTRSTDDPDSTSANSLCTSILLTAIENQNIEIIDFLITYWTFLIQQLPFDHQVRISLTAIKTNQFEVLSDLLEFADYPFPKSLKVETVKNERFHQIYSERVKFKSAIKSEDYGKIDEFLNKNLNLKFIFSPDNNSALTEAIQQNKFGVFYYLKSLGYQGENCQNILQNLSKEDKEEAIKQAKNQRKANVNKSLKNVHKSILILSAKSLIHNRRTSKEQEAEYRQKIMKWFEDIFKIAPEMLNIAASCDYLKIIFDFESDSVENASLAGPNSLGSMYPVSKWIFIGSQLSDKKREQQIKGVLAHELCHYTMKLVYENQENPYYKNRNDMKDMFEEIVKVIDKWSSDDSECPDDECFGIISTVFTLYCKEEFHLELIVRVVQILVEFDNDEPECRFLQDKYKILFDFWYDHVVPEMILYLHKNKDVIKLNKIFGLLPKILNHEINFAVPKDLNNLMDSKLAIITTNIPNLLFISAYKFLQAKYGILLDSQNFFTSPEKLNNQELWNDFKQICIQSSDLNIFVDCTNGVPDYLDEIFVNKELNYVFILSNECQHKELIKVLDVDQIKNARTMNVSYKWSDLAVESQELLLQTELNFQNKSDFTLLDLLNNSEDSEAKQILENGSKTLVKCSEIVEDQLLNLMLEHKPIFVNSGCRTERSTENFDILVQPRTFIRKNKDKVSPLETFCQEEFIKRTRNEKFVLISDKAGNGKSWAMRNFSKVLSDQNPSSWVSYVDLKQFIDDFKAQESHPQFSTFVAEKILNLNFKFEAAIFQKLYNEGRVMILFDGFDEIAPTCAEFVLKLAKSFEFNGGNQLWIATRDYFEVDLAQKLKIDVVYGIDDFSEDDGVDFIAKSWILSDKIEIKSKRDFEKLQNFEDYKWKARRLIKKVKMSKKNSVGMPQLFKMIAKGFKDSEDVNNLQELAIYTKFIQNLYRRWSDEKGQLRKEASVESQQYGLNFWKFHQYMAIASLFPKSVKHLIPNYDDCEWSEEEIVACGVMTKIGEKIFFVHESFREFFVADFIAKFLKSLKLVEKKHKFKIFKKNVQEEYVIEIFVDILTNRNYNVIRMFLSDAIDKEILQKIKPKVKKLINKFYNMKSFSDLFYNDSENITDYILDILKTGSYWNVHKIIKRDFQSLLWFLQNPKMFNKLIKFVFEFLNSNDLKAIIKETYFLNSVMSATLGIEIFVETIAIIEAKTDKKFVQKELKDAVHFSHYLEMWEHSFFFRYGTLDCLKLKRSLEILHKYLTKEELTDYLTISDIRNRNIIVGFIKLGNAEYLRTFWTEMQKYLTAVEFKNLIEMHPDILQLGALYSCDFEIQQTLWELMLTTFDRNELLNFILQQNESDRNFIFTTVQVYEDLKSIEWTFDKLKEIFTDSQFENLVKSRTSNNTNLLQITASSNKSVDIHKLVWKTYRNCCKTDQEFKDILKEVNAHGISILDFATETSSIEVIDFILENLESKLSSDEFKTILSNSNSSSPSLLHSAASNFSSDILKTIWRIFQKYFEPQVILKFTKLTDELGNGFFFYVQTGQAFEFVVEELEKITSKNEIKSMISALNNKNQNIMQIQKFQNKPLDYHKALWTILKKFFDESEILKLIRNTDSTSNNIFFNLACGYFTTQDAIDLTWNEIASLMTYEGQIEYLKLKSKDGKNLAETYMEKKFKKEDFNWIRSFLYKYNLQEQLTSIKRINYLDK